MNTMTKGLDSKAANSHGKKGTSCVCGPNCKCGSDCKCRHGSACSPSCRCAA